MSTKLPPEDPPVVVDSKPFGRLLRKLREQSGWTQQGIVKATNAHHRVSGMVVTALSHWEDGRRIPSPPQLAALIKAMEPVPKDLLELLDLAATVDARYAGLVQVWATTKATRKARIEAFEAWAATFPSRRPRRKSWREAAAAAIRQRDARTHEGEGGGGPPATGDTKRVGG